MAEVAEASVQVQVPTGFPATVEEGRRFRVELTPGETTIVSWKKLLRDDGKGDGGGEVKAAAPSGAHPKLESRIAPVAAEQPMECEPKDGQPPSNRFNAVIEKIERLYTGKGSSDEEEVDDLPDDDQYDTEDSFIDDAELNDYFQIDKSATKYSGFFINRGKLERIERSSSPTMTPKKRRRKDSTNLSSERGDSQIAREPLNMGNMRMKDAARHAPLVGKKTSPSHVAAQSGEHHHEGIFLKHKSSITLGMDKKKVDTSNNSYLSSSTKLQSNVLALPADMKDFEKQKSRTTQSVDTANKSKVIGEAHNSVYEGPREKGVLSQTDCQSRKLSKDEHKSESAKAVQCKERNKFELPDLNSPGPWSVYPMQSETQKTHKRAKEAQIVRPKGTTLDRAIRDLEKIVAESRPPKVGPQEGDTSQGIKKRLPTEVKQKLAKVARLADSQGKIIVDRLMGILGHLVQQKTLKRHLKEMVETGLSVKQAKVDKFQQIKKEVTEMIKAQTTSSVTKAPEQQTGSSDDFQDPPSERFSKEKYNMDAAMEDKICDLYDLYVEGMDEDRGPQARKLYVELAELWPTGYMDNLGIKDAVYRAKERKKLLHKQYKAQDEERLKRKRLTTSSRLEEEDVRCSSQSGTGQDRLYIDSSTQVSGPPKRVVPNKIHSSSGRTSDLIPYSNGLEDHHVPKHHEKIRSGSGSIASDEASKAIIATKKLKRKQEAEIGLGNLHSKPPSNHGEVKDKSYKRVSNSNETAQQTNFPLGSPVPKQS